MDNNQFGALMTTLSSMNANLVAIRKQLKTISDDNEMIKVHMKRMNTKDTSSNIYNQVPPAQ